MTESNAEIGDRARSSDASRVRLKPGLYLDRYELIAPVAAGGMASVWLGRLRGKHDFEKLVAIKTILPEHALDPDFRAMFLNEVRITSRIKHVNVAEILDVGDDDGLLYQVMEWVSGESLQTLHKTVRASGALIPVPVVLRVMADMCRGLHAAHELHDQDGKLLGVVHRDVSPHNILVDFDGTAKLIDFGIAKAREQLGQSSVGTIKGKSRYLAPEQVLAGHVDRRADIWAVGATLQNLLTGNTPYSGRNDFEVLKKILGRRPPNPVSRDLPACIRAPVQRALSVNPEGRFPTAEAMAEALEAALEELGERTISRQVHLFVRSLGLDGRRRLAALVQSADRRSPAGLPSDGSASGAGRDAPEASASPRSEGDAAPMPARAPARRFAVAALGVGVLAAAIVVLSSFARLRHRSPTSGAATTATLPSVAHAESARPPPAPPIDEPVKRRRAEAPEVVDAGAKRVAPRRALRRPPPVEHRNPAPAESKPKPTSTALIGF